MKIEEIDPNIKLKNMVIINMVIIKIIDDIYIIIIILKMLNL